MRTFRAALAAAALAGVALITPATAFAAPIDSSAISVPVDSATAAAPVDMAAFSAPVDLAALVRIDQTRAATLGYTWDG
jgi:hypothetical protein